MGRTLTLRACPEHGEACQLQSLNGGEWEHTPASRIFVERIKPVSQRELEGELATSVSSASDLVTGLAERQRRADSLLARLEARLGQLERVEDVYSAIADAEVARRVESAALHNRMTGLVAELKRERGERIENMRQFMRSISKRLARIEGA